MDTYVPAPRVGSLTIRRDCKIGDNFSGLLGFPSAGRNGAALVERNYLRRPINGCRRATTRGADRFSSLNRYYSIQTGHTAPSGDHAEVLTSPLKKKKYNFYRIVNWS